MKILLTTILTFLILTACTKEKGNMQVSGQIKGLKKGTLYLQKKKDTLLVSVDSIKLLGKDTFLLTDNVESPEMYYITFDANTTKKYLMFFGEKGNITISNRLDNFGVNPKIEGSKNQKAYEKFKAIDNKFSGQYLELVKKEFKARKTENAKQIKQIEEQYKKLTRKRFLFATQYAKNHNNMEVAPYIALSELFNANVFLLDTINTSLTPTIKKSKYGVALQKLIKDIKATEK